MTAERQKPPPGWYLRPEMVGSQQYWDGDDWAGQPVPAAPQAPADNTDKLLIIGFALALLFPIAGFVAGAIALPRSPAMGAVVMVLSIAMTVFWFIALT